MDEIRMPDGKHYTVDSLFAKLFNDFKLLVDNQNALNERINQLTNVVGKMSEVIDALMVENNLIINEQTGAVEKKNLVELEKNVVLK